MGDVEYKHIKTLDSDRGFKVAIIHYSMDEEKDLEWAENEKKKYMKESADWEKDWDREMEIDFTTTTGARAYPMFNKKVHCVSNLLYNPMLPLLLACDFNVEPMAWVIAQRHGDTLLFIDEIYLNPADIDSMVREFRNKYPAHPAEVWVYGDATGKKRTAQTAKTDYQLMRLAFMGYPSPLIFRVPMANPLVKDRLNAFNLKLRGSEGKSEIAIDPNKCPELVKDLEQVVVDKGGSGILKLPASKREDPYYFRTHASDAAGYLVYREFPVIQKVIKKQKRIRRPRRYKRLLGMLR